MCRMEHRENANRPCPLVRAVHDDAAKEVHVSKMQLLAMAALAGAVAGLAALAAGLGVFARGDGAFETVTSVRGVTYEMATNGVYAYNSRQVVAEGVGWDVFTLFVAVPAMLVAAVLVARGSFRARLVALGLFGYFVYQYLEYAMTWALGPLFPLFILLFALSGVGIIWFAADVVRAGVADRFATEFPRRAFASLNVAMALLLTVMWIGRISAGLNGDLVGAGLHGETTMVVQALDLGLVVPTALLAAFLVWRRSPAGYPLAAVYSVTALAMSSAIVAMLISASVINNDLQLPPIVIFGTFVALSGLVARRIYRAVVETEEGGLRSMGRPAHRMAARPLHG